MKKLFLFASAILALSACSQKEAAQTAAPATETDSTYTVSGQLVIAHEVRAFTADGDTTEQWIIDKSGKLISDYRSLTGDGVEKATPVKAVLKVKNLTRRRFRRRLRQCAGSSGNRLPPAVGIKALNRL